MAARVGYCGLDRRHEPLQGDEVRVCWEDGALALAPDPVTPGLLDLLTVGALNEPSAERDAPAVPRPMPGLTTASASGSRRLWVEVEA